MKMGVEFAVEKWLVLEETRTERLAWRTRWRLATPENLPSNTDALSVFVLNRAILFL
jgi:hypothetical protein